MLKKIICNNKVIVKINYSSLRCEPLKLYDCEYDIAMVGVDFYLVLLGEQRHAISHDDLLFYNSKHKNENGDISSSDNSVICKRGLLFDDEELHGYDDNFDCIFEINFDTVNPEIEEIILLVGRPASKDCKKGNWINYARIKNAQDDSIDILIDVNIMNNDSILVKYFYNRLGAICILHFFRNDGFWFMSNNNRYLKRYGTELFEYKDGLREIINRHFI